MERYQQVFENNKKWVAERTLKDKNFFEELAKEQNPDFLFIGCSDSRVEANEIMGMKPGDVFVQRNIANLVDNNDVNVQAVIQYAVEYLNVKYITVCGHYGCGGIKAAMKPTDMGLLNCWLRNITDVYRMHYDELKSIKDEEVRYRRLVELNVHEQCLNVAKIACVQKAYLQGTLKGVFGWVYDIRDGVLKDLNIDFQSIIAKNLDIIAIQGLEDKRN